MQPALFAAALCAVSLGLHVASLSGADVQEHWPGVFWLHPVVLAACLSAVGLLLAILTLVFAQTATWAWLAILAIIAFWPAGVLVLYIGARLSPPVRKQNAE